MKKTLLFIIVLLFITGCNGISRSSSSNVLGGEADGVRIEFLAPEKIFGDYHVEEGKPFDVIIELENNAECDVNGNLKIRDFENINGIPDADRQFSLPKNDAERLRPYTDEIFFGGNNYDNVEKYLASATLEATVTYGCRIVISPQLCVRPKDEDESSCDIEETISGKVGGLKTAPITVTKIKKKYNYNTKKLSVEIYLDKMGDNVNGVIGYGKPVSYMDDIDGERKYGVPITVSYGSYGFMDCDHMDNYFYVWQYADNQLQQGKTENVIKCDIYLSNINYVEKNDLTIEMEYYFELKRAMDVVIKQDEWNL